MDLKGAEIRGIKELCGEIGQKTNVPMKVIIPYYQRPYKWGEQNIRNLIDDFYKNDTKEYFVGSAVMISIPGQRHEVIDGQQRITTMFLLTYLKFMLQRAYVEELINNKKTGKLGTAFTDLCETSGLLFGDSIRKTLDDKRTEILNKIDEADPVNQGELFEQLLQEYQKVVFLPEKNLSDVEKYAQSCYQQQLQLLAKSDLALKYSRTSYNVKLKEALARFVLIFTDSSNPMVKSLANEDHLVNQYLSALQIEFDVLNKKYNSNGVRPFDVASELIKAIDRMVENIKFCVIITGNENDAYTLFEVLNDRSLEIEDLDLIKNLFYKWYCNHSGEDDASIDATIEDIDMIWVEKVFPPEESRGKEKSKLISFLAAEYFTADDSLKFNENERYREKLESKYLEPYRPSYTKVEIKNDIYVYLMLSMLIKKFDIAFTKKAEQTLKAESDMSKSITYKALNELNALKQYGVMPAITNIIIKKFVNNNTDPTTRLIKIENFDGYLDQIIKDANSSNVDLQDLHKVAFSFWKFALLSSNAELPRNEAKKVIAANNVNTLNTVYDVSSVELKRMQDEFDGWIENWRYGKTDTDLKAKILFIHLTNTNYDATTKTLSSSAVKHTFSIGTLQLDHMEAANPSDSALEKYFQPINPGEQREKYTNSIGNFMVMDGDDNNNKDNLPLKDALKYYDKMCPGHWAVEEVRNMLQDDKYSKAVHIDSSTYRVPTEAFFTERKNRLREYFKAILSRKLGENSAVVQ